MWAGAQGADRLTQAESAESPVVWLLLLASPFRMPRPPTGGSSGPMRKKRWWWRGRASRGARARPTCRESILYACGGRGAAKMWGSPRLWQLRRCTSLRKAAWSAGANGISRSLNSCPRQLCSRHSTMSLAGQGPSARGTPSGSAQHTLYSAPRAFCCPSPCPSPDPPAHPVASPPLPALVLIDSFRPLRSLL